MHYQFNIGNSDWRSTNTHHDRYGKARIIQSVGKSRRFVIHECICTECGQKMFVPRRRMRERGHIKDLYCISCGKITGFRELYDDEHPSMKEVELKEKKEGNNDQSSNTKSNVLSQDDA